MPIRSIREYINLDDVESGMMVQFTYTKVSGGSDQYVVLVVDPRKPNKYTKEPQLHGFIIKELSDSELVEFFTSFKKTTKLDYDDKRASVIEGLNTDEAYKTFASSRYVQDRTYRTFNLKKIKKMRQILLGTPETKQKE